MYFKTCFDEAADDCESLIGSLSRACKDLNESKKFKELLKIVLALGNYMNSGQRGGAFGFKNNSLLKVIFLFGLFVYDFFY